MQSSIISGSFPSTDRFNAAQSSKSGANVFVITAMRVMAHPQEVESKSMRGHQATEVLPRHAGADGSCLDDPSRISR